MSHSINISNIQIGYSQLVKQHQIVLLFKLYETDIQIIYI